MSFKDLFSLQGKTSIVTGGCGILGKHFCEALAARGSHVAIVDIREKEAVSLAKKLNQKYKIKALGVGCDITQPQNVNEMLRQILKTFKTVHILHNNAAGKSKDAHAFFEKFERYSLETWREIMAINLDAMFLVAQAVSSQMIKQEKGGSIIQTASIYGLSSHDPRTYQGSFYLNQEINNPAVYSASKGGVIALTKYLSTHLAPHKIRVNTLTPGGVFSGQNKTFQKKYSDRVPLGRMAHPQEMVGALIYLASGASSYVTGHNLIVDGGLTVW
ncbi:MAG: SDR family oxidoreductase [Candidatus Omnitrophica bacterium]|nr:SDR family oxidoreductase [Candidatus Omnitrophota bacterium]